MPIFPKKSIKGKGKPKLDRKKKTFSYLDLNFKRQTMSTSPKKLLKGIKSIFKKKKNLKSTAKSEAKAFFNSKKMTPTTATLRMKEQQIFRRLNK